MTRFIQSAISHFMVHRSLPIRFLWDSNVILGLNVVKRYGSISSVDFFVSPAVTFWGAAQLGGQILTIRPTASGFGIIFHFFGDGHAQVMAIIFQKGHVVQPANPQHSRGRNIHSRALSRSSLELKCGIECVL